MICSACPTGNEISIQMEFNGFLFNLLEILTRQGDGTAIGAGSIFLPTLLPVLSMSCPL